MRVLSTKQMVGREDFSVSQLASLARSGCYVVIQAWSTIVWPRKSVRQLNNWPIILRGQYEVLWLINTWSNEHLGRKFLSYPTIVSQGFNRLIWLPCRDPESRIGPLLVKWNSLPTVKILFGTVLLSVHFQTCMLEHICLEMRAQVLYNQVSDFVTSICVPNAFME